MITNLALLCRHVAERRDNYHLAQAKRRRGHSTPERGQVILVAVSCFHDKPVTAQTFEKAGDLMATLAKSLAQVAVVHAVDIETAFDNHTKQFEVLFVEEIETGQGAARFAHGPDDLLQIAQAGAGIVERRDELQIAAVRCPEKFAERRKAVDRFLQRRCLHLPRSVAVFHPSVVFEETDVVDRGLDSQDQAVLVVHLDRGLVHVVLDAGALNAGLEAVAHLPLVRAVEFASEEGRYVIGLYGAHGGAHEGLVDRGQFVLLAEDDVGGVFHLHQAPVIAAGKQGNGGAEAAGVLIEFAVEFLFVHDVGQCLRFRPVANFDKGVVEHRGGDSALVQGAGQGVVAVEVKLQAEGRPCGHAQVAQPQVLVDEVEVIVQALAGNAFEECAAAGLVMPGPVTGTTFHCRDDMDHSLVVAALAQDLLDDLLLALACLPEILDGDAFLFSQGLGVGANLFAEGFGPLCVIEYTDLLLMQVTPHAIGVADARDGIGYDDPVETREFADDLGSMTFCEQLHCKSPVDGLTGLFHIECAA